MPENSAEYIFGHYIQCFAVIACLLFTGFGAFCAFLNCVARRRWNIIVRERRQYRDDELQRLQVEYPLNERRTWIINLPFDELIYKLQSKELLALEVLEAFTAKTVTVTKNFNCVTEFIPNAFDKARALDISIEAKGPLFGLPICVKDDTDVDGMDTTVGCAKNLGKPKTKNATIVQTLMDLGAIPFCKTNVPQTLLAFGSHNPVYGETLNPLNAILSPGGSSSGTGCLIGAGGVLVGTGSDIGGSVRIPAHFNGISALRPTYRRHSSRGVAESLFPGMPGIKGVPGIMGKSSKIVATVFKSLTEGTPQYKLDNNVALVPWDGEAFKKSETPLRIGFYTTFDYFPAMGDTATVVLEAKNALETAKVKHILVPFEHPHSSDEWLKILSDLIYSDGGVHYTKLLDGENISHSICKICLFQYTPICVRKLASWILWFFSGKGPVQNRKKLLSGMNSRSSHQLWTVLKKRRELINQLQQRMDDLNLDLILGPVFPFPALRVRGDTGNLLYATGYTMYYNLVDFPAGVVKFGTESGKLIHEFDCDGDPWLEEAHERIQDSITMPIGVQIIGRPFKEEVVLRIMVELEEIRENSLRSANNSFNNGANGHNSSAEVEKEN